MILPWKALFLSLMFFGPILSISASSWFMAWVGLEINMLAILSLLMNFSSPREKEATLKYFLMQTLASATLLASALLTTFTFQSLSNFPPFSLLIFLSLLTKMGAAPFHMWLPQVVEGLSWFNSFIVLTWQKVAPSLLLLNCFEVKHSLHISLTIAAAVSAILGALSGLSQTSVRKILSFSSINHLGWALASLILGALFWAIYFFLYCTLLFSIILLTKAMNISSVSASSFFPSKASKIAFYTSLFSLGGLPPFLGFLPKWIIISKLTSLSPTLTILMVMSSLPPLFFYLNMAFLAMHNKTKTSTPLLLQSNLITLTILFNSVSATLISSILLW